MQRVLLLLTILFALYACTTTPPPPLGSVQPMPAPAQSGVIEVPLVNPNAPVVQAVEELPPLDMQTISLNPNAVAHIALLLPLKDPRFSELAQAVRDGFMAAASMNPQGLPIRVYSDFDENRSVVDTYRLAVSNGANAVVGPLTRNGVSALAAEQMIPVPTLVLNTVDMHPAEQLYFFGLPADDEARTVAQLAAARGFHNAVVITNGTAMSQRLQLAFEEAWTKQGLTVAREIDFRGDTTEFKKGFTIPNPAFASIPKDSKDPKDLAISEFLVVPDTMVFLALDNKPARMVRPYLPGRMPIYATSQVFSDNEDTLTNYDLSGVRFVDMPWLLQPDHPAVIAFPHPNQPLPAMQERLYALGIDAYRLSQLMLAHRLSSDLPLDGVIGQINLNGHTFQRTAVAGVFSQGRAVSTETVTATPAIQMFPDQFKSTP
ncbi:MAG: penicillin-binding protein activator [Gallionella sp.]